MPFSSDRSKGHPDRMHEGGVFGRDLRAGTLTRCTVSDMCRTKLLKLVGARPGILRTVVDDAESQFHER